MLRLAVPAVIMLLALAAVGAMPFPSNVSQFETALTGRVEAIHTDPNATPEEQKEASGLEKALATLGTYENGLNNQQLAIVAKAMGAAYKTGTQAAGVTGPAGTLIAGFNSLTGGVRNRAENWIGQVLDPVARAKVQAAIDKAETLRGGYSAEADWGKAAKILMKAMSGFGKAEGLAWKCIDKQNTKAPVLDCSVSGHPDFSADPKTVRATSTAEGLLVISGTVGVDPKYSVVLGVQSPGPPGIYSLENASTWYSVESGATAVPWFPTSGTVTIDYLGGRSVSGTFAFVSGGALDVTAGVFRAPIK